MVIVEEAVGNVGGASRDGRVQGTRNDGLMAIAGGLVIF